MIEIMDDAEKEKVLKLIKTKDDIELKIRTYGQILQNNNIGLTEQLVDAQGYPRSDIDIVQVREARQRIICLQNDLKDVMKQIEIGLHAAHAPLVNYRTGLSNQQLNAYDNSQAPSTDNNPVLRTIPICIVNLVSPGSPADNAGLQAGDQITEFGSVQYENFRTLADIGKVVQSSVCKRVNVVVLRNKEPIRLTLIPKQWAGNGLLGCNIIPLEESSLDR